MAATSNTTTMSDAGNVRSNGDHVSMLLSALLGGHSGLTTVVALLTTERSSCQRCCSWFHRGHTTCSEFVVSPTVVALLISKRRMLLFHSHTTRGLIGCHRRCSEFCRGYNLKLLGVSQADDGCCSINDRALVGCSFNVGATDCVQ